MGLLRYATGRRLAVLGQISSIDYKNICENLENATVTFPCPAWRNRVHASNGNVTRNRGENRLKGKHTYAR